MLRSDKYFKTDKAVRETKIPFSNLCLVSQLPYNAQSLVYKAYNNAPINELKKTATTKTATAKHTVRPPAQASSTSRRLITELGALRGAYWHVTITMFQSDLNLNCKS